MPPRSPGPRRGPSPATSARPAHLTPHRDDDPEVTGRAPARDESWIPPLGLERPGGALEPPVFVEPPDAGDEEDAVVPEDDEPARGADPLAAGDDDALAVALAAVDRDDDDQQDFSREE